MKKITAETTDEQILAPVKIAKETLAQKATDAVTDEFLLGDRLVKAAQDVMDAEAVASVAMQYRNILSGGGDVQKRTQYLLSVLTRGADDTWSGRSNDSKRSAHDAVRTFVDAQFDEIRYGN